MSVKRLENYTSWLCPNLLKVNLGLQTLDNNTLWLFRDFMGNTARWRFTIMTPSTSITDRSEMPLLHSVQSSLKVIGRHLDKKRKHSSSFVKKIHGNSHICDNHEAWFPWLNTPFHAFLNNGFLKCDDEYFDMPNHVCFAILKAKLLVFLLWNL